MQKLTGKVLQQRPALSRSDLFSLFVGTPLLLALLVVEIIRVSRAVTGDALLITGVFGSDVSVQWSTGPLLFVLGAVLHLVIIVFVLGGLWAQFEIISRWRKGRRYPH